MAGRLINGIKYMSLCNDNDFKKGSLEDNVYFNLRDIFINADSYDDIMSVNLYNGVLTNNITFEDRTKNFQYTNVLYEKNFVERLQRCLKYFNINSFEFEEPEENEEIDMNKYIKFDEWWFQFEELKKLIDEQYEKCLSDAKRWEEEDIV